jgi:lipoprotein-anchoring transpeptidase ErfK/SrfK
MKARSGFGFRLLMLLALAPITVGHAQSVAPLDSAVQPAVQEAVTPPAPQPAVTGPLRLEVDVSERVLRVMDGEQLVKSYPVAVGQSAHPTPRGSFAIRRVIWNPRWVPPNSAWARGKTPKEPGEPGNPMGRVKLFFSEPDYYIHGTENQASLGRAESHGCVRMANDDVVELAQLVMERGGQPRPQSWFHRLLNVVRSTSEVQLSNPITVVVTA